MRYAGFTILLFHTMWFPMVSHGFPWFPVLSHGKSVQIPYHLSHVSTAASHCGFLWDLEKARWAVILDLWVCSIMGIRQFLAIILIRNWLYNLYLELWVAHFQTDHFFGSCWILLESLLKSTYIRWFNTETYRGEPTVMTYQLPAVRANDDSQLCLEPSTSTVELHH